MPKRVVNKTDSFLKKKASSLRSSWKKRSLKYKVPPEELPTTKEIYEFLKKHHPFTCEYERDKLPDTIAGFDHNIPVSRGGSFKIDNIVVCNKLHNLSKGDLTGQEYKELLSLINSWEDKGKSFLSRLRQSNAVYKRRKRK